MVPNLKPISNEIRPIHKFSSTLGHRCGKKRLLDVHRGSLSRVAFDKSVST